MVGSSFPGLQMTGARPMRVLRLAGGTGVFSPLAANSLCRITLVGGGASGGGIGTYVGGGGGATIQLMLRVDGPWDYAVGAAGIGNNIPGGNTRLGPLQALGGAASGVGGAAPASIGVSGGTSTGASPGNAAGLSSGGGGGAVNSPGGGGNNSVYGKGGDAASTGTNATGYGAGGGGSFSGANGGNGSGGLIIIEEFGP